MDLVWRDAKNREFAFQILLDANYDYPVRDGWNQLTYAAYRGHAAIVDALLIDFEWDLEARDFNGFTALYAATLGNQWAVVDRLLYLGADPTAPASHRNVTPIVVAESQGFDEIAQYFRDRCPAREM